MLIFLLYGVLLAAAAATAEGPSSAQGILEQATELEAAAADSTKVAYLFLTQGNLPLENVWASYFAGCPAGSFSIIVHSQAQTGTKLPEAQVIPPVVQGDLRMSYGMNQVMWQLLKQATGSSDTQWFHFLSESCLPVKPCSEFHSFLSQHQGKSFVGNLPIMAHDLGKGRCHNVQQQKFSAPCIKSSQWTTLHRPHVDSLLNAWIPTQEAFWKDSMVPDEHMIATIFHQNNVPVTGYTLTYVKWPMKQWPEPLEWQEGAVPDPLHDQCIRSDLSHPCDLSIQDVHLTQPPSNVFFARKVTPQMLGSPQVQAFMQSLITKFQTPTPPAVDAATVAANIPAPAPAAAAPAAAAPAAAGPATAPSFTDIATPTTPQAPMGIAPINTPVPPSRKKKKPLTLATLNNAGHLASGSSLEARPSTDESAHPEEVLLDEE